MQGNRVLLRNGVLISLVVCLALPGIAGAATITIVPSATDEATSSGIGSGGCSLREAVRATNQNSVSAPVSLTDCSASGAFGADTINVPGDVDLIFGANGDDDVAVSDDLDVTDSSGLEVIGTGGVVREIDANSFGRVFEVPTGGPDLTLRNLKLTGGRAFDPGNDEPEGGGIRFLGNNVGDLTLDNTDVIGNQAKSLGGGQGDGGGIDVSGAVNLTITDGLISANEAGGSDTENLDGTGGGIRVDGGPTTISITDSAIVDNHAGGGDGGGVGRGGGLYVNTSGASSLTITDSQVQENRAGNGVNSSLSVGGGLALEPGLGTLTTSITDGPEQSADISANRAGGGGGTSQGDGGGLYVSGALGGSNALGLTGVSMTNNQAGADGGPGTGRGGAIAIVSGGTTTITSSTISSNRAGFDPGVDDAAGKGGGVFITGSSGNTAINGTTLSANRAGETAGEGGAIYSDAGGNLTVSGASISTNEAGATNATGDASGGGITRSAGGSPTDSISSTSFTGNIARSGSDDLATGGGIAFASGGSLAVQSTTFSDNLAHGGGTGLGGAMLLESAGANAGDYTVTNATVHNNEAEGLGVAGGGIQAGFLAAARPSVEVVHATITANNADIAGAGGEGDGPGGNISALGGIGAQTFDLRATILADGLGAPSNCNQENAGVIQSDGENVSDTSAAECQLTGPGDQTGVEPLLGPLALNGEPAGSPLTRALLTGSPAIDSVENGCPPPATDARGVSRPQGPDCDASAFERAVSDGGGGGDGDVNARCGGRQATEAGDGGSDRLRGTAKRDVIAGLGGNDVIRGLAGKDILCGGRGRDRLVGGRGRDKLFGQAGGDLLRGGPGRDLLKGGPGRDRLLGGPGRDLLRGGPGRDRQRQ